MSHEEPPSLATGPARAAGGLEPAQLLEHHTQHFEATRSLQWRNNTGVWTALLAVAYVGVISEHDLSLGICFLPFVVGLHIWWNRLVQASLDFDKDRWSALDGFGLSPSKAARDHASWLVLQGSVTSLLALITAYCLWLSAGDAARGGDAPAVATSLSELAEAVRALVERVGQVPAPSADGG